MENRELIGMMGCTTPGGPQWRLEVERDPNDADILLWARFSNPVRTGTDFANVGDPSFYSVEASAETPFGNPLTIQEPHYAHPAPTGVEYRRMGRDKTGKALGWEGVPATEILITGYVIKEGDDIVVRSSYSGMRVFKGQMPPTINDDGTVEHDGKTWHLQSVRHPDRDRFDKTRFAAVFGAEKPDFVKVMELFDF